MEFAVVFIMIVYLWSSRTGRRWKARLARIRKVQEPDARIGYMDLRGKRSVREISIESAKRSGPEWLVTAWCHKKKEFFIFHSARMYEFTDLKRNRDLINVQAYFDERFRKKRGPSKGSGPQHWPSSYAS
jgi:hypothetical protein